MKQQPADGTSDDDGEECGNTSLDQSAPSERWSIGVNRREESVPALA